MNSDNELVINGITYIPKESKSGTFNGLEYKIVRTHSAGVFAGYLQSRNGQEVILLKARRLWYWSGAASLSQLAEEGVSKPKECKFPQEVEKVELLQVVEILDVTKKAQDNISKIPDWKE